MTLVAIDSIDIGERYRHDMGDLSALAASIDRVGLLHPVVVMGGEDGRWRLVAGERRLRACRSLGWERILVRIVNGVDLLQAEHDENVVREPFTPSEAVAIAAALRPVEEAAARERQGTRTDLTPEEPRAIVAGSRTDSRDRIAAAVGMGRTTLARAEAVVEAAAADPVLTPLVEVMDETRNVAGTHAALQALPPEPEPEQVAAVVTAVRERRRIPDPIDTITPEQAARFPEVAASRLSADLAEAIYAVRTARLDPKAWADRVPEMAPDDIASLRSKVAHVHRWADDWDALLTPRPLSVVGGTK